MYELLFSNLTETRCRRKFGSFYNSSYWCWL